MGKTKLNDSNDSVGGDNSSDSHFEFEENNGKIKIKRKLSKSSKKIKKSAKKKKKRSTRKSVKKRKRKQSSEKNHRKSTKKKSKAKAPVKKRVVNKELEQLKKYYLPGQKYPEPQEGDSSKIFYQSLYQQNPESKMAIKYCLEYGLLTKEQAIVLHKKLQKKK